MAEDLLAKIVMIDLLGFMILSKLSEHAKYVGEGTKEETQSYFGEIRVYHWCRIYGKYQTISNRYIPYFKKIKLNWVIKKSLLLGTMRKVNKFLVADSGKGILRNALNGTR